MIEFKLPSLGADMDQGTLLEWRIAPGQAVKKGDVVAVVDTSKAAIDVEAWVDATVLRLITEVGQTIPVGTVMAWFGAPGESTARADGVAPVRPVLRVPAAVAAAPTATTVAPPAATVAAAALPASRVRASPAARQAAAQRGIALDGVPPTGPGGVVTLADVERFAPRAGPSATDHATDRAAEMRRVIAAAMARSKREIPHYYLSETVPMRIALDWLTAHNAALPVTQRILPAVLVLKAVALALRGVPELNGIHRDGRFEPSAAIHVGVAISLRRGGLVAPALHDVDAKPLARLMAELADLVQRARAGSLRSSELADPTITVTNLGDQGVEAVYGVIYPPQVALVGVGRVVERAWVVEGRIVPMPVLALSLSADHRVSDGHRGAIFLSRLRDLLQQPESL